MHEDRGRRQERASRDREHFLLSGLLYTPDGIKWHAYGGDDNAYRLGTKGKRVNAPWLESEVLYRVACDFKNRDFLATVVAEARRTLVVNFAPGVMPSLASRATTGASSARAGLLTSSSHSRPKN